MSLTSLTILLLFGTCVLTVSTFMPIVQTEKGLVGGEILRTARRGHLYASFKGIPYAEPPIGYLRFQVTIRKKKINFFPKRDYCTK